MTTKRMLGELLVDKGLITSDQLRVALTEQKRTNIPLGKVFVQLGFATESIIRDVLSEALGQESVDISKIVVDSEAIKLLSKEMARRYRILPISFDAVGNKLHVAMSNTFNVVALDQISATVGRHIEIVPRLAGEAEIEAGINQFYGYELSVDGILREIETGEVDYQSLQAAGNEYSQPLIRLIDALLADAVKRGASDIHFEPENGFLRVRYRIDGVLRQARNLHKSYWPTISVRLKVMAGMNIAETRAPQDGRISLSVLGRQIDFRAASHPTTYGENIVLRILDRQKGIVPLESLGLTEEALRLLKIMMARPEGIILVTGPTGSGKTTTLYSMLNYLNSDAVNIMTLEDPVEYPMSMIRQTSVNEAAKLDFSSGIRSMMRQDPDIILVGEIRDHETAEMALRAAMTGHQVYSTLHTNSAIGSIPRLLDIGVVPDILAGNLIGIVAQRLVRKLCVKCRAPEEASEMERMLLNKADTDESCIVYRPVGCQACERQGYKGRLGLLEILKMDADIDELIARRATLTEIRSLAEQKGFSPIAEDGIRRVLDGTTSLDEVSRVVDLTARINA